MEVVIFRLKRNDGLRKDILLFRRNVDPKIIESTGFNEANSYCSHLGVRTGEGVTAPRG